MRKLKMFSLTFLIIVFSTIGVSGVSPNGSLNSEGKLILNNHTFERNASSTTEKHGSASYQAAKEYYEYQQTYSDYRFSTSASKVTAPPLYITVGDSHPLNTDTARVYSSNDEINYVWPYSNWYTKNSRGLYYPNNLQSEFVLYNIGSLTNIPAGYHSVKPPTQTVNSPDHTWLFIDGTNGTYASVPFVFDGNIKRANYTSVDMTTYNLSNPITAVPSGLPGLYVPSVGANAYGQMFSKTNSSRSWKNQDYDSYLLYWQSAYGTPLMYPSDITTGTGDRDYLMSRRVNLKITQQDYDYLMRFKNQGFVYVYATETGGSGHIGLADDLYYTHDGYGYFQLWENKYLYGLAALNAGSQNSKQLFHNMEQTTTRFTHVSFSPHTTYTEASIQNCFSSATLTATVPVEINGGQYTGAPALNSKQFTVNKGTLTDTGNTKSVFLIGPDSEQTVVKDGTTTITTVKLSNETLIKFRGALANSLGKKGVLH